MMSVYMRGCSLPFTADRKPHAQHNTYNDLQRENAFGLLMSLNMLIDTPDGFDYTGADCASWMREAELQRNACGTSGRPNLMVVGSRHRVPKPCDRTAMDGFAARVTVLVLGFCPFFSTFWWSNCWITSAARR